MTLSNSRVGLGLHGLGLCVALTAACSAPDAEQTGRATPPGRYVVRRADRDPSELREAIAAAGLRELAVMPDQSLLVERALDAREEALAPALRLSPWRAADRVSRELEPSALAAMSAAEVQLLIHVPPGTDARGLEDMLAGEGLAAVAARLGDWSRVGVLVPRERAAELAERLGQRPDVHFVERPHRLGLFNGRSAGSVQTGMQGSAMEQTAIWQHGLRGEGQVVGLIDTGVDADACWFRDASGKLPKTNIWSEAGGYATEVDDTHSKVIAYDFLYSCAQFPGERACDMPDDPAAWDGNGHGTHCAGSMVGDRPGGMNLGMAPAAKLVVQDGGYESNVCSELPGLGCPAVDHYPMFEQAYKQGVRIHNNSYGDNEEVPPPESSNYTARSQDVDRFIWDHKDMLIVFAAGNSGTNNADFSVASPSTNKNGLSVGSARASARATSDDDISSFSSRGWTSDGRIKPDLVAPGCTVSAASDGDIEGANCGEDTGCGTSYSSPILVGAAALVRQYFSDGFYPSGAKNPADARVPSAALLKGMLINGAVSMTGRDNSGEEISPIPSNEQGWGRIQLDRSLIFAGASRKLFVDDHAEGFAAGATAPVVYTFRGVESREPFKVTLTWADYPGTPDMPARSPSIANIDGLNPPRLVNDLDLTVGAAPGGETFLGNVFENGSSMAGGMADRRNNVEQVLIASPAAGDFTLSVLPTALMQPGQDFALVVTGQWASVEAPGMTEATPAGTGGMGAPAASAGTSGTAAPIAGMGSGGQAGVGGGEAPSAGAVATGGAGASGASAAAAVGMRTGAVGVAGATEPTTPAPAVTTNESSGGCATVAAGSNASAIWLVWLLSAVALQRRRRRSRAARTGV